VVIILGLLMYFDSLLLTMTLPKKMMGMEGTNHVLFGNSDLD